MPPSDPAPEMSNSFHQCGRCARPLSWNGAGYHPCYSCGDIPENARLMSDPAAVPPPEWAVEMAFAHTFPADYNAVGYAEARRVWAHLEGTSEWRSLDRLARLLASVREGAINSAADVAYEIAEENPSQVRRAILSLLHTPPSGGAG